MTSIGIITIHNLPNYGACLQSFALYKFLETQGYEVEIIDLYRPSFADYVPSKRFRPYAHREETRAQWLKRKVRRFLNLSCCRPDDASHNVSKIEKSASLIDAERKMALFNSHIRLSKAYRCIDYLYANPPVYDIYITGSDQVWNPEQSYCVEPYFLGFVPKGKRKISYASSVGITELTHQERRDFRRWLKGYDRISVRERQGCELLAQLTKREIARVCDPTFLLAPEYWRSIMNVPPHKGYILVFTLERDSRFVDYGLRLAAESGKRLVLFGMDQIRTSCEECVVVNDGGPADFLGYIANAGLVITDSFHCTVFSIIMGTDFYTYIDPSSKRGSRVTDLLESVGMDGHILDVNFAQSHNRPVSGKTDWEVVAARLQKESERSQAYLLDCLKS